MTDSPEARRVAAEVSRRRTFAIISHPDAGKTTLTEKLLLYGGAIHEAGAVKARRAARHATSDWMELEKQRGISVTSSVMQFTYDNSAVNILDTPGHQDFSEDTYRTLSAADCAVMLIDAAKGVEPQTEKLFRVCQLRKIPVFTFVNKMDRVGRDPLDLMDEIESHLGMRATPMAWPLFDGATFQGVYDRTDETVHLFEAEKHGATAIQATGGRYDDPIVQSLLSDSGRERFEEELELLDIAGDPYDEARVMAGDLSPMFFGSALTNFGVELFLKRFLTMAPPPRDYQTVVGEDQAADSNTFSGFVFKIQANMDKSHRDRIAFLRICSGRFSKGMEVWHPRNTKKIRLANPSSFMARERSIIEEAFAGDIIGLYDPGLFRIGDTISSKKGLAYKGIPHFSPEAFRRIRVGEPLKRKQLAKGLEQLAEEGAIQVFGDYVTGVHDIIGAVGTLQFDVLLHRLKSEYNVTGIMSPEPYTVCRWIIPKKGSAPFNPRTFKRGQGSMLAKDRDGHPVILFSNEWSTRWAANNNEGYELRPVSPVVAHAGDL